MVALQATVARSGAVNDSSYGGVLAGGGWGTLPSPAFKGRLDEIAIYPSALSASTVQQHYTAGTAAAFTVSSSITNGSTLAGPVSWVATPSRSASKVEFYIDGALRWTESIAPFVFNGDGMQLDTRTLSDGSHLLKAVATATDGTKAEVERDRDGRERRAAAAVRHVFRRARPVHGAQGQRQRWSVSSTTRLRRSSSGCATTGRERWRTVEAGGIRNCRGTRTCGLYGFVCDLQPVGPRHAAP